MIFMPALAHSGSLFISEQFNLRSDFCIANISEICALYRSKHMARQDDYRMPQQIDDCGFVCRAQVICLVVIVAARQSTVVFGVARDGGLPGPRCLASASRRR